MEGRTTSGGSRTGGQMAGGRSAVVGPVRALFGGGAAGALSDGQLLRRFVDRGCDPEAAEAAFAVLVARHGPMVLGVCRRALRDPEDVADAFQATFLVLVRKADSVRVRDSLGRWLYGVSRRVAAKARTGAARRGARETSGQEPTCTGDDPSTRELLAALDEEVARLPEPFRAAVVLCDLGGLTHEAAAEAIGCPVGTVESRLSRGRRRLRDRLTRRGFSPTAAAPVVGGLRTPALPESLSVSTVKAATASGAVRSSVFALLEGVLTDMAWIKIKTAAAAIVLAVLACGLGLVAARRLRAAGDPPPRDVEVSTPVVRDVTSYQNYNGTAEAGQTVEVRPRITGTLVKVHIKAGQPVKRGAPLFDIDEKFYAAEREKARSDVLGAEAAFKFQTSKLARYKELLAKHAIPQEIFNEAEAKWGEAQAALGAARALSERAELNLERSHITSPINGVVGRVRLSEGNPVTADVTPLTTVVSLDPLYVAFNVDQLTVLRLNRLRHEGKIKDLAGAGPGLPAGVRFSDETEFPHRGQAEAADVSFDQNTGTLRWRVPIGNPDKTILPGMHAAVRLSTGPAARVVLVAERAVFKIEGKPYVLLVNDRNSVERRAVKVGALDQGMRVIEEGLTAADRVVSQASGPQTLRPGTTVLPKVVPMPGR
jgi:RND family efflux transporter MFP subunit